jgi:adenine-specific DNA-methyltransferase
MALRRPSSDSHTLARLTAKIVGTGPPLEGPDEDRPKAIDGHPVAWPMRSDGKLGIWRVDGACLKSLVPRGYAFVSGRGEKRGTWTIRYLMSGIFEDIDGGILEVVGKGERGEVLVRTPERRS